MIIKIMAQNIARGGLFNSQGEYEDRWPKIAERINKVKPDILLLNELNDWTKFGHKQLVRACNDLGMEAAPLAPTETGYGTGLLYRQERTGRWQMHNPLLSHATTHGFAVTGFDLGLPELVIFAPVHLCFYSAQKAVEEAQLVANRTLAKSPFAVIGGDINHSPAGNSSPDFTKAKPYNWAARTVIQSGEPVDVKDLKPNRQAARTLKRAQFVDTAHELYERTKDEKYLEPTVEYERIDQIWLSSALRHAIVDYELVTLNPKGTDHAGVVVTIDTDKVDTASWKPELL